MGISVLLYPIFLLIYLIINNVQLVSNIPLPQKEKDVVLSAYIRHYEPAIYDPDRIQRQQKRLRRSTGTARVAPEPLRINITAPHRVFKLVLYPETNLFAPDVVFETDDSRSLQFDPGKIYQGTLEDDPSAVVQGLITSAGLFDGTVTTRANRYYIEPSSRYLTGPLSTATYHTVVYSEDDVIKPSRERCASEELRKQGEEALRQDGRRRKKEAQRGGFVPRRRKDEAKRKEEEEKRRREEEEALQEKEKEVESEEDAAKIKYETELREEEARRKEVEILREKEEAARKAEEKLREEELERRKEVDLLRVKEEEARKEELLRRKEVEALRQKEADVLREKYEQEIREEELRRKEVEILVQKEEEARKEEELRRIEVEILRLIEENVRKEELARRKNVNVEVRKEEKARREEDIRRKEEEILRLKEQKARSEEEFRRKEVDILRLKEEQAVKDEEKAREAELERRKAVEVLRLEEEKARNEEAFRRKEVELLVLNEQAAREKEEKAREEELERRKEVDALRGKEEEARKEIDVARLKEVKAQREEDFRRQELASLRRKEAELEEKVGGSDGGGQTGVEGGRRRRPGGASGGEKKKVEMGSGLRTHRQTGPYSMSRTMRDENQDIDTILRVEAPNRTIISISRPGLKSNTTQHRGVLVNSRPAPEYDESLDQFDSFFNRNPKFSIIDAKKTTCMLYLQADHLFFEKYGTEESCIEVMTRHVQRVNSIYKNTDFNQDGFPDNITFMIKRIKVHTHESVSNNPGYRFQGNYGVEKFLEIFSEEDYDAFCLAYMFTYRDFEMGTLGLAWTGDLKNAGGVCEKNGHYRGSMKSLNTGIVTLLNYGKHVPPAVSHVTLAHEIGHNFGSPHDPEICTPGGDDGNYIMFARATSGDKKNNNKFSQCSLNSINPVLNTKARSGKGCFIQPQVSLCGNGVVEEGEECDCGWEEDCKDACCHPQRRYPTLAAKPCTLTPGSDCSPSQGPCCTPECRLKTGDKCRDDNGCRDSSFCSGKQAQCPPSINKPNKTVCNAEFVCYMGECTGSICLAYGLESCQCIPGPGDPLIKACELCCKMPGENQPCLSSFLLNTPPYDVPDMYSKPGSPCNEYNGYCDVYQKCREVDPSGPLATLRRLLLSDESINSAKKWALEHWYYSGLMFLSFLCILVLSVRLFGRESDLKKKGNVTMMHNSSTTETVRLPPDAAGVTVHPVAVRAKLPLKKKVRERGNDPPGGKDVSRKIAKKLIDKNLKKNMKPLAKIAEEDPLGKVRHWLLHSHHLTNGLNSLRQSKSSPAGFVAMETSVPTTPNEDVIVAPLITIATEVPPAALDAGGDTSPPATKPKGGEKSSEMEVKLQVVFKPPFNFSVKLRKPNKVDPKKGAPNKGVSAKKIEKSTSSNRLIDGKAFGTEEATPSEVNVISGKGGKVAKHKLLDKNVPEQVKKRAALLIRADKTLRRSPKHKAKKSALAASQKVKSRPALLSHPTDLARLISHESQISNQSKEDEQAGASCEPIYEPVYENADVEAPAREKLEKLQKHSRNIEAVVRRQNSGESQQAALSPSGPPLSYADASEDLIDMNGEAFPGVSKRTNLLPAQEDIRKKHRSKRKKTNDPKSNASPNDSNYKLEKRYSMSDVPSAPAGVPRELRHSNCDLASQGPAGQGSKRVGPAGNNAGLRHSSSDVMKNLTPDDAEPIGLRKSSKRRSSRRDNPDGSDAKKRHSMSELSSGLPGPTSYRTRLPNACPSTSPSSHTSHLASAESSSRSRGLADSGSKRHSMSDVPSEMHIYENLLDNELIFSTANPNVRNGLRASLNGPRAANNHKSFNQTSNERSQRNTAGANQSRPHSSGDTKPNPSSFTERTPPSSLTRSSNQNLSSPRHNATSQKHAERYASNSALHQGGSSQSSQERNARSRSLNRSQSSNHVTQPHHTHAQSPPGQPPAPAYFSAVPAPPPLGPRSVSSHDLMRFPSVETEANTRLDYLISGKK